MSESCSWICHLFSRSIVTQQTHPSCPKPGKQAQITPLFPTLLLHIQKPPTVLEHLRSLRAAVESTDGDDADNIVTSGCEIIRFNNAVHIQLLFTQTFFDPHSVHVANGPLVCFCAFKLNSGSVSFGTHGYILLLNASETALLVPPVSTRHQRDVYGEYFYPETIITLTT